MDNEALNKLNKLINDKVSHEINHALGSPTNINRVVGESMRHIGTYLEMASTSYLPIRPEEVLVKPVKLGDDCNDAVLLLTRTVPSENAFLILANSKTIDGERVFDITAYQPDSHSLGKTVFLKLTDEIGNEIIRQLNVLINGDGSALVQCVIAKDYFKTEEEQKSDAPAPIATGELLDAENFTEQVTRAQAKVNHVLPEVTDEILL